MLCISVISINRSVKGSTRCSESVLFQFRNVFQFQILKCMSNAISISIIWSFYIYFHYINFNLDCKIDCVAPFTYILMSNKLIVCDVVYVTLQLLIFILN